MAKKVIEVEVQTNIPNSINQLKELKKELKSVAAGSKEFDQLSAQIRDLDDSISDARKTNEDFLGQLESAPGPLGMLGKGIRGLETTFSSFNGALKASVIGIIVLALGGLYKAFSDNETAMKKIQPLLDGLEKAFSGVFRALEPVFNALVDMAVEALPVVTKGIGLFYSAVVGLFTFVKEGATGYINLWKGILTLDFDKAKEGVNQMKDSFATAVKAGEEAYKRFEAGSKENTRKEAEEAKKAREEAAKTAAEEQKRKRTLEVASRKKVLEDNAAHSKDVLALEKQLLDDIAALGAKSDLEKLADEKRKEKRDIEERTNAGAERIRQLELLDKKYVLKAGELFDKATNEQEARDKLLAKLLDENSDKMLDIKTAKNNEEIDEITKHNKKLLDEQKKSDLKAIELLDIANGADAETKQAHLDTITNTYIQKELDAIKVGTDAKVALAEEEAARIKAVEDATNATKRKSLDQGLEILSQFLGKNKAVALAILAVQKGLAISDVVVNTAKSLGIQTTALGAANMKVTALYAGTPLLVPALAANTTLYAKSAIATKVGAAVSIASILAAGISSAQSIMAPPPTESGAGGAGGGSTTVTPPNYTVVGTSPTNLLSTQAMAINNNQPLRAYVVSNDVTSAQALERNIITSATIG